MESRSATGNLFDVSQVITSLTGELRRYYAGVRDAREDIDRLYRNLVNLKPVFTYAEEYITKHPEDNLGVVLLNPSGPLQLLKTEIETLEDSLLQPQRRRDKALQSLKWPLKKDKVDMTIKIIKDNLMILDMEMGWNAIATQDQHADILIDIQQDIGRAQEYQERRQLVDWLTASLPDPSTFHNAARRKCATDTGTWLINGAELTSWSIAPNSLLWLTGGAGAGKSILCSTVIEYLQRRCSQHDLTTAVVAYWYFSFTDSATQDLSKLMCSVVRDLCSKSLELPPVIRDIWSVCNNGQQRPTLDSLSAMLIALLNNFDHAYLVFDGLDECPVSERICILDHIHKIRAAPQTSLHLLITSRREEDIKRAFDSKGHQYGNFQAIEAHGKSALQDIKSFIGQMLQGPKFSKWTEDEKENLSESLALKSDGMFRLVALHMDELSKARSRKETLRALHELPTTLSEMYTRILTNIPPKDRRIARAALCWLMVAARPLSLGELAEAVHIRTEQPYFDPDDRFLDSAELLEVLTSGLVRRLGPDRWGRTNSHYEKEKIQLAHYSVSEFLKSNQTAILDFGFDTLSTELFVAERSMCYLLSISDRYGPPSHQLFVSYPLLSYASEFWDHHMNNLDDVENLFLDQLIKTFWMDAGALALWTAHITPQFFPKFQMIVSNDYSIPFNDDLSHETDSSTAFSWAISQGINRVVDFQLSNLETLPNVSEFNKDIGPPLHAAVWSGKSGMVVKLLESGQNVNGVGGRAGTALHAAVILGEVELVKLLLSWKADVNLIPRNGQASALAHAMRKFDADLARLLIESGANVNALDKDGTALLHLLRASALDNEKVGRSERLLDGLNMLLDEGANPALRGVYGFPLNWALAHSLHPVEITKLFLDAHVDVTLVNGKFGTVLHEAVVHGHDEVVLMLLNAGADPNAVSESGLSIRERETMDNREYVPKYPKSVLQMACDFGTLEPSTIALLLREGAHVNGISRSRGHDGISTIALNQAYFSPNSTSSSLDKSPTVLKSEAPTPIISCMTMNTKFWAEYAQVVLQHGADIRLAGGECQNAVEAATWNPVRLRFLLRWVDKMIFMDTYEAAMSRAIHKGHIKAVETLLQKACQLEATPHLATFRSQIATRIHDIEHQGWHKVCANDFKDFVLRILREEPNALDKIQALKEHGRVTASYAMLDEAFKAHLDADKMPESETPESVTPELKDHGLQISKRACDFWFRDPDPWNHDCEFLTWLDIVVLRELRFFVVAKVPTKRNKWAQQIINHYDEYYHDGAGVRHMLFEVRKHLDNYEASRLRQEASRSSLSEID